MFQTNHYLFMIRYLINDLFPVSFLLLCNLLVFCEAPLTNKSQFMYDIILQEVTSLWRETNSTNISEYYYYNSWSETILSDQVTQITVW